jgi:hypothetical protein
MSQRLLIIVGLFCIGVVHAAVDLPLLTKQNLAQPCLSVSYATSANATVKAKTDAKNGELVQAGENSIYFSIGSYLFYFMNTCGNFVVDWNQLEASPGVINLTPMTNVIQLINTINATAVQMVFALSVS